MRYIFSRLPATTPPGGAREITTAKGGIVHGEPLTWPDHIAKWRWYVFGVVVHTAEVYRLVQAIESVYGMGPDPASRDLRYKLMDACSQSIIDRLQIVFDARAVH